MKRIEMIKLIRKALEKHIQIPWNEIDDSDKAIGKLLKEIEKEFEFDWSEE